MVFPNQWYYESVDRAAAAGYMQGVGNGKFCPNDCVTRGQLVTLLYRYSGETATKEELANLPFRDVKQGRFYTEPIAWAYARGIVKGYDANTFGRTRV